MYSSDPPSQVLYCYGIHQDLFDEMERTIPNFYSKQGLPTTEELDDFTKDKTHKLIIIDDLQQVGILGRQLYPGKTRGFLKAYEDALSEKHGYLLVDMSPHSEDKYRLRTHIFPGEDPTVYRLT